MVKELLTPQILYRQLGKLLVHKQLLLAAYECFGSLQEIESGNYMRWINSIDRLKLPPINSSTGIDENTCTPTIRLVLLIKIVVLLKLVDGALLIASIDTSTCF